MNQLKRVAIIGGTRIPFCRSNSAYAQLSNLDMLTDTQYRDWSISTA